MMTDKKTHQEIVENLLHPNSSGKKKALIKKKAKTAPIVPPKHYYEIKVESLLPGTIFYCVLAETPVQALDLMKVQAPVGVKYRLVGKKDLKLTVSKSGSSIIELTKNLGGK
jgi:hypothetical protein